MGWLLIIVGILLLLVTIKSTPKNEKDAQTQELILKHKRKYRIVGIIILLTGIGLVTPDENSQQTNQIPPQITVETKKQSPQSKYASMKTLTDFDVADAKFLEVLNKGDVKVKITASPLADGTPRRMYQAQTAMVEFLGKPEVKEVTFMMIASTDFEQTTETLILLGATLNAFCTDGNQRENGDFIGVFTKFLKDNTEEISIDTGRCKSKLKKPTKELPWFFTTFEAK